MGKCKMLNAVPLKRQMLNAECYMLNDRAANSAVRDKV